MNVPRGDVMESTYSLKKRLGWVQSSRRVVVVEKNDDETDRSINNSSLELTYKGSKRYASRRDEQNYLEL